MKKRNFYHNSVTYKSFDHKMSDVEDEVINLATDFLDYDKDLVVKRLLQRITELKLNSYISSYASSIDSEGNLRLCEDEKFSLKAMFSTYELLKLFSEFYVFWLLSLFSLIKSFFYVRDKIGNVSLLSGVGKENYSADNKKQAFAEYCANGPVKSVFESEKIIVQSTEDIQGFSKLVFHRFPLIKAIESKSINLPELILGLKEHAVVLFRYHYAVFKFPLFSLLGRDAGCHVAAKIVNKDGYLKNIVFTNSNYAAQPLWSSSFNTHMLWYSMNFIPLVFKEDMLDWPLPNNRFMNVDCHWVWSEHYAEYLRKIGVTGRYVIVDPILWCLDTGNYHKKALSVKKVCLFDITPVSREAFKGLGIVNTYYDYETISGFINGVLDACEELSVTTNEKIAVYLKPKREYQAFHDERYINDINELHKSGRITFLKHDDDIHELINTSDLVISVPYSSPSLIAALAGKVGLYYDSADVLFPSSQKHPLLPFVSDKESLKSAIETALKK